MTKETNMTFNNLVKPMSTYFILSLDTELHWGYHLYPDSMMYKVIKKEEDKVIYVIEDLLELFEKYNIPATWAVVGEIFISNFKNIVEKIFSNPVNHEIGYHSFTHVPFSESSREKVDEEIRRKTELENDFGITLNSFVYPENKISHIDILKKYGFQIYRGPNLARKNVNKHILIRTKNLILSKLVAPPVEPIWRDGIWEIPSSMLFFGNFFSGTLVSRAKYGIKKAIKEQKIFHIFMHPEDLLVRPELICQLEEILKFVSKKRQEKELQVVTMGELASILDQKI